MVVCGKCVFLSIWRVSLMLVCCVVVLFGGLIGLFSGMLEKMKCGMV